MMKRIPLTLIYGNPNQPRRSFDPVKLGELADNIRENGLKQPITVRPDDDGKFMIVMGERRFRAHQLVDGCTEILCHVSKVDDSQLSIDAIIENDQRVDVTPLEQGRSYQRMIEVHGFTLEALSRKLGKPVFRLEERLRLLALSDDCQFLLEKGQISREAAWYLSTLSHSGQAKLLRAINAGQCPSTATLKAATDAIQAAEAQVAMFDEPANEPTKEQRQAAKSFELKVEQVAAMLRAGIKDNEVVAVKAVDPNKTSSLADLLGAMVKDIKRLETALRVSSIEMGIAA